MYVATNCSLGGSSNKAFWSSYSENRHGCCSALIYTCQFQAAVRWRNHGYTLRCLANRRTHAQAAPHTYYATATSFASTVRQSTGWLSRQSVDLGASRMYQVQEDFCYLVVVCISTSSTTRLTLLSEFRNRKQVHVFVLILLYTGIQNQCVTLSAACPSKRVSNVSVN